MKKTKAFHTPRSSRGMGDYYGQGIRQPVARLVDFTELNPVKPKKLKKPPKSLA